MDFANLSPYTNTYIEASIVADNIHALENGGLLKKYVNTPDSMIAMTLSSRDAIGQIPYVPSFIADRIISFLKSSNFMLWKIFGTYGQKWGG